MKNYFIRQVSQVFWCVGVLPESPVGSCEAPVSRLACPGTPVPVTAARRAQSEGRSSRSGT